MTKNKKIIIAVIIALLIIIPISTLAITGITILPRTDKETIEEENKKDNERLLEEKAKWEEEHKNDINMKQSSSTFSSEEKAVFEEEEKELKEKEDKIKNVMNKYHKEEFEQILQDIANSPNFQGVIENKNDYIAPEEIKLYEIVIQTIEEENLSNEDKEVLRGFIEQQKDTIDKNNELKARADRILE